LLKDLERRRRLDGKQLLKHVQVGGDLVGGATDRYVERVRAAHLDGLPVSTREVRQVRDRDDSAHGIANVAEPEAKQSVALGDGRP